MADDNKYNDEALPPRTANTNTKPNGTKAPQGTDGTSLSSTPPLNKKKEEKEEKKEEGPIAGLPTVVDVGGQLFDLKADSNVNSGFYGREAFDRIFGNKSVYHDLPVKRLLQTYLPVHQTIRDIQFKSPEDYDMLLKVLRLRANQLHTSSEYQSHVVRNIPIKKYEARLLEIIQELKGTRKVKKAEVAKLRHDEIFYLVLEMAWYLANPNEVPEKMQKEWSAMLEKLDKPTLGDILELIHNKEKEQRQKPEDHPLQYFKKIDMGAFVGAKTLEQAKALVVEDATAPLVEKAPLSADMRTRFNDLLTALRIKGWIDDSVRANHGQIDIVYLDKHMPNNPQTPGGPEKQAGGAEEEKSNAMIENKPNTGNSKGKGNNKGNRKGKKGSASASIFDIPLGQAILPIFDYLRILFDPVYSMLEQATPRSVKRGLFPHLLLLLHLCNELQTPPAGRTFEYGLYHIKNIPHLLVDFLKDQLKETENYILDKPLEGERLAFQKQLFHLPKVRLRSLLRNNGGLPTMADEQHSIFHLQFFVVGENLLPLEDDGAFKKRNPTVDSKVCDEIRKTWIPGQVFLAFTDSGTTTENIPFRFFEVDYEVLDVREKGVTVGDYAGGRLNALTKEGDGLLKPDEAYVEKLAEVKPYAIYNDGELALSALMALKEHMPKE